MQISDDTSRFAHCPKASRLSAPWFSLGWLCLFFVVPTALILVVAMRPADLRGGIGDGWTFENLARVFAPIYLHIWLKTLAMSLLTTLTCLLLALPVAWYLSRCSTQVKNLLLLAVILPFLSNFIIRIFAWRALLHPEGAVKHFLLALHLIHEDTQLLNHGWAVVLVTLHTHLPFAILPLYSAAEKFDFQLYEAARDLGADAWQAVCRTFLPSVLPGLIAAGILVMISCLGQYVIPQWVGGTGDEWIGNKIVQRAFGDRHLPLAAALSCSLLFLVALGYFLSLRFSQTGEAENGGAS